MLVSFHTNELQPRSPAKMPKVPPPEDLPNEAQMREKLLPTMPDPVRRYLRARATDRTAPGRVRPLRRQEISRRPLPRLDPHHRPACPTISPSINAAGLRLRHDACLTPRSPRTAAPCSKGNSWRQPRSRAVAAPPFRADDWLLYAQDSPNLHGSRGFSRGLIFTRDGMLGRLRRAGRLGAPAARIVVPMARFFAVFCRSARSDGGGVGRFRQASVAARSFAARRRNSPASPPPS